MTTNTENTLVKTLTSHLFQGTNQSNKGANAKKERPLFFTLMAGVVIAIVAQILDHKIRTAGAFLKQELLRQKFNVTTTDDFLKGDDQSQSSLSLLSRVQNDTLWRACDKITSTGSMRFWYYPDQEPNNIFEEIAIKIYKPTEFWNKAASYEYWCNIIEEKSTNTADDSNPTSAQVDGHASMEHPWHTDRDEDVLARENIFVTPLMGAVYYGYNTTFEGGKFHMIDAVPYKIGSHRREATDDCNEAHGTCITNPHLFTSQNEDEALFVPTKFNRLLMANVTHFHKVTKVLSGKRYALAVNANHWMPYDIRQAPSNEEMIDLANKGLKQNVRDYGF
jgi:hypothetical protein